MDLFTGRLTADNTCGREPRKCAASEGIEFPSDVEYIYVERERESQSKKERDMKSMFPVGRSWLTEKDKSSKTSHFAFKRTHPSDLLFPRSVHLRIDGFQIKEDKGTTAPSARDFQQQFSHFCFPFFFCQTDPESG